MDRIGIIEDDKTVIPQIKLVIKEYLKKNGGAIEYKEYFIEGGKDQQEQTLDRVLSDIEEGVIQTLFVDYKLNTSNLAVKGSEIIKTIREKLTEFPMIILTNVVADGKESKATDADKVYNKEVFLNPDDERSEEMVENVLLNMKRYRQLRESFEINRDTILQKMHQMNDSSDDEKMKLLNDLIMVETELQKYTPTHLMAVERIFPIEEYKEVLGILREYKELLDTDGKNKF